MNRIAKNLAGRPGGAAITARTWPPTIRAVNHKGPDTGLAPGVPADYYDSIVAAEQTHWWYRGMREIADALLGDRLMRPGLSVLDAGCGTGGFLRWILDRADVRVAVGIDVSSAAIAYAETQVPEATFAVAPLSDLPQQSESFDLVVMNDVLQHVPEADLGQSLAELKRLLVADGVLLVRTNGARTMRRERHDWRAYDAPSLERVLVDAGFRVERVTYANFILSLWGEVSRSVPHAPTEERHGIPTKRPGRVRSAIGLMLLRWEALYLRRPTRRLPFGHTLFALASVPTDGGSG